MRTRLKLFYSAMALLALPDLALAASAPAATTEVEAVVVTARKREENLQETPVAVTAVPDEVIKQRNLTELRDIQNVVPNVLFTESQGLKGTARIFIRGIGENIQIFSADPAVGVYIDGIPLSRPQGANLNLLDVERVEVLRGPQGTTFGKNTIGGSINYVSKRPGDIFGAVLKGRLGNYDAQSLEASVDLPFGRAIGLRVTGAQHKRTGFIVNEYNGGELSDLNNMSARAVLEWQPTAALNVVVAADYFERDEASNVPQLLSYNLSSPLLSLFDATAFGRYGVHAFARNDDGDPYRGFFTGGLPVTPGQPSIILTDPLRSRYDLESEPNGTNQEIWGSYLIAAYELNDSFTLKSLASYRRTLSNTWFDAWGTAVPLTPNVLEENAEEGSGELQLLGNNLIEGRLNFILGAFVGRTRADETGTQWFEPELMSSIFNFSTGRDQRQVTQSVAFFGNGSFALTEKLELTLGARWTQDEKRMNRYEFATFPTGADIGFGPAIVPGRPGAGGTPVVFNGAESWDAWSGVASLQYQWTSDVMTYASWSRGFRSGGFSGSGRDAFEMIPFNPEFVDSYELGVRSTLFERRLILNATAFWMDYQDRQMQLVEVISTTPFISRVRIFNAGESEQKGIELEAVARPIAGLQVTAAYGFTDAGYTRLAGPFSTGGDVNVDIQRELPQTPKHTFNTGVTYRTAINVPGTFILHGDYSYRSKTYYDVSNSEEIAQAGYGLVNARVAWESPDSSLEIALWGRNLTEQEYRTDGIAIPSLFASAYYGDPRTFGIELTKTFP